MSADPSTTPSGAFERLLQERYSCRAFLPRPVDTATITKMLEIAQRTPSWCNSQPWQVVITRGAGTDRFRDAIFEYAAGRKPEPDFAFPREYRGVYLERRRECGFQLYDTPCSQERGPLIKVSPATRAPAHDSGCGRSGSCA